MKHIKNYIAVLLLLLSNAALAQRVDLTLDQCRVMSRNNSADVLNADLAVEAAEAQRGEALAEYFPKVSASAFGFYSLYPMVELGLADILGQSQFTDNLQAIIDRLAPELGINTSYSTLQRGGVAMVSLMQPVFAGGRIVAGNKLAKLGVEAAVLKRDMAYRTSDETLDMNFWQVVALQEKQHTIETISAMLDTIYRDVESAHQAGLASNTDLMQVELKKSELRVGQIQLTNGIRLAKMNLLNTIGMNYSYIDRSTDSIPYLDSIFFSGSLANMLPPENYYKTEESIASEQAEMKLLDLSVRAQQLQRRMVLGEALPQIAVGANYGYSYMLEQGKWNGAVYAMVQVPISDWGKKARNMQRLDRNIEMAENDRKYLSEQILLQIRQLWLNLTSSWQQMVVSRQAVDMAKAAADQSMAYYRAGMITVSELLQSQTSLANANEAYINQAIEYTKALNSYLSRVK